VLLIGLVDCGGVFLANFRYLSGLPDIVESNSGTWNLYYRTQIK